MFSFFVAFHYEITVGDRIIRISFYDIINLSNNKINYNERVSKITIQLKMDIISEFSEIQQIKLDDKTGVSIISHPYSSFPRIYPFKKAKISRARHIQGKRP